MQAVKDSLKSSPPHLLSRGREGRAPLDLCQVFDAVVVSQADRVILLLTSLKLWVHRRRTSLRSKSIVLDYLSGNGQQCSGDRESQLFPVTLHVHSRDPVGDSWVYHRHDGGGGRERESERTKTLVAVTCSRVNNYISHND